MKCPICDIEMRVSDRDGVEIDYCSQCRGVWLDRGELEKIVARVESQQLREREGRDDHDADDHYRERHTGEYRETERRRAEDDRQRGKRKEGFFSNLFDMFGD